MEPFTVTVLPDLGQTGQMRALAGTRPCEDYHVGGQHFCTPDGIDYDIQLSNTGEAILLSGAVRARAVSSCARCLEPARVEVTGEAQGYYLLEDTGGQIEGLERDEYEFVDEDGRIDLAGALGAALVHATPFVVLCEDECAGLCPKCGANLNEGPCACDADDEVDPTNPFSVLKDFKFDDK